MNDTNSTEATNSIPEMVLWYWSVRAVIAILTVLGNGLVMYLITRNRKLRVIPNAFIFALALSDFLVGAVITPTDFACTYWHPHDISCNPTNLRLVFDILIHLSVTNLCSLTFDRYMAVVRPLKYHNFMSRGRVVMILAITWLSAALFPSIAYICLSNNLKLTAKIVRVIDMTFLQILPPILLAIAYMRMLYIARQHEKTVRLQHSQLKYNYGHRSQNTKYRSKQGDSRERSSVKMIGAVIVAFFLCYILAIFRSLFMYIMDKHLPLTVVYVSRILLLTNSAINFLAYAFLKKDFKQELQRMCKQKRIPRDSFTGQDLTSKETTYV